MPVQQVDLPLPVSGDLMQQHPSGQRLLRPPAGEIGLVFALDLRLHLDFQPPVVVQQFLVGSKTRRLQGRQHKPRPGGGERAGARAQAGQRQDEQQQGAVEQPARGERLAQVPLMVDEVPLAVRADENILWYRIEIFSRNECRQRVHPKRPLRSGHQRFDNGQVAAQKGADLLQPPAVAGDDGHQFAGQHRTGHILRPIGHTETHQPVHGHGFASKRLVADLDPVPGQTEARLLAIGGEPVTVAVVVDEYRGGDERIVRGAGHDEKGIGQIEGQAVGRHLRPGQFRCEDEVAGQLKIPPGALPGKGGCIESCTGERLFRDDGNRQLVIRKRRQKLPAGQPGAVQQRGQRGAAEGARSLVAVPSFDAHHGFVQVVLGSADKILEAQLVFDGDDQLAAGLEQIAHPLQHAHRRLVTLGEQGRVFEYPDQGDHIETLIANKLVEPIGHHGHIVQIPGPRPGHGRATGRPFQGQHPGAAFPEVAGDRPAAGADLKHLGLVEPVPERPQQVGPAAGEMVEGSPVCPLGRQLP